nr:DUF4158 domain-containing protein [Streptomyces sp. ODS25]
MEPKRREHNRLGFAVQMTMVRYLGVFLDDPIDVPTEVVDYLAGQLGIADTSVLEGYGERWKMPFEHMWELREAFGYREFGGVEAELREWVDARAWTAGEWPKARFDAAVVWLRERRVLLPGVTTLVRLVASVRAGGERAAAADALRPAERRSACGAGRVAGGAGRCAGLGTGPAATGAGAGVGSGDEGGAGAGGGGRRVRHGGRGRRRGAAPAVGGAVAERGRREASLLRRHGDHRRLATLLATAVYLTTRAVDDALDLLEVLVATKLLARSERETTREKLKTLPRVERAGAKLAAAFKVVFEETAEQVDTATGEISVRGPASARRRPPTPRGVRSNSSRRVTTHQEESK